MPSEYGIDITKLSTQVAQRAIDRLLDFAEGKVKEKWAQYKNKNTSLFAQYIQAQSNRCAMVRTLLSGKESVYLPDIYVPLRARTLVGPVSKLRHKELTTQDVINLLSEQRDQVNRRTLAGVVSAPAGAGKTFFMRNLYIKLTESSQSKVPLFLEARELNRTPLTDFPGIVTIAFRLAGLEFSREQALDGLKSGIFTILIDGFDELRLGATEKHYAGVLDGASQEFQMCPILVSGRPSEIEPTDYNQFELLPLYHEETVELIQRMPFDEATKLSFIALMRKELFDSHAEFLELPLLCVVMLLTYSDSGRISHKRHEFYEDAFNALWSKHDARRQAGYVREKSTGLEKGDFVKLLSAFCASSYVSEHFSMRETELSFHLARAKKLTNITAKDDDFIRDMTTSTSLLILEGNTYRFAHRSFQEYFCAGYVLSLNDKDIANGVDAVSSRYGTDAVLDFGFSMNAERLETIWVIPKLSSVIPLLQNSEQSFTSYQKLFNSADGDFLKKVRQIYVMNPSNDALVGAIAAWIDMRLPESKIDRAPQGKLFLKDIANFETLLDELTKRYSARALMRAALFETGNKSLKSVSRKSRRLSNQSKIGTT